jgi:hypothetical protein
MSLVVEQSGIFIPSGTKIKPVFWLKSDHFEPAGTPKYNTMFKLVVDGKGVVTYVVSPTQVGWIRFPAIITTTVTGDIHTVGVEISTAGKNNVEVGLDDFELGIVAGTAPSCLTASSLVTSPIVTSL